MEDYIKDGWSDAVEIGFNETIARQATNIVKYCEEHYFKHGHQWRCDVAGKVAILLKPGEGYEWHFDNAKIEVVCYDFVKPMKYPDGLNVAIQTNELQKWLNTKAY